MSDWTKQAEEMIHTWTEAQKRMRDTWMEAIQNLGGPQSTEMWARATTAWEETVKRTLEAQAQWARMWVESFTSTPNAPKEITELAHQGQEIMKQWTEAQQRLWEGWFEMVRNFDASKLATTWDKQGAQNMMQVWQESTQKALNAQAEWIRRWVSIAQSAGQPNK